MPDARLFANLALCLHCDVGWAGIFVRTTSGQIRATTVSVKVVSRYSKGIPVLSYLRGPALEDNASSTQGALNDKWHVNNPTNIRVGRKCQAAYSRLWATYSKHGPNSRPPDSVARDGC